MKTKLMSLLFLAWSGIAMGQTLSIPDVEALPGETVSYSLNINVGEGAYTGYQYDMQFPATGFTLTGKTTTNENWIGGSLSVGNLVAGAAKGSAHSGSDKNIPSGDIEIGTVEFTVDPTLETGKYDVTISGFDFLDGTNYIRANDVTFTVNVVAAHTIVLDEESTVAPEAATGVNVRVKRTIKANEWSTICLPFAMTAEQITSAFGTGVQVKDFNGIESMTEGDDIVAIEVKFNDVNAIEANHPYVIKLTSKAITYEDGFIVEGVDIAPTGELSVDKDETKVKVGSKLYTFYNSFVGTYVAGTTVPENGLFLNGNQFWYSNGSTIMKGFRGYFSFMDVLSEVANASTRIGFNFDETTGIKEVHGNANVEGTYDLQGRKVEEPTNKGLYIVNGRKVVKK